MTHEIAGLLTQRPSDHGSYAAVWQVLMPVARDIERVQIVTNRERGFEDMTISFAETFTGSLNTVLRQFEKMAWVATAGLC
ncbi:hypothetical protein WN982_25810 [Paraburkholderia sp. IMGN_8]|uniref:hypothetical protein n=1 Tax=Paraburkholderia sp. IMGN_8 TaxID=3136564 RepID=UPI003101112D